MVVPRKPWRCGNEYHTICCCLTGIMFAMELVEGRDEPPQMPPKEYSEKGKTVGLYLRLTKLLRGKGSIVVMDSGFCVLSAIIELSKVGVFSHALIKKRRYWPRHVDGDKIKEHFDRMNPGEFDALKGRMNGVSFYICGMKEPDYVLLFMTTYGTGERLGQLQKRKHKGTSYQFQYPEVCHMHYSNRDSVDNHNSRRMSPIAIEEQLKTTRWPMR